MLAASSSIGIIWHKSFSLIASIKYLSFHHLRQWNFNFYDTIHHYPNALNLQFQFIILALVSAASAARLDNSIYLPPNARSSSGASAGLEAPFGGQASYNAGGAASASSQAEILNYENEINEEGYRYAYETSDGTKAEQQGGCYFFKYLYLYLLIARYNYVGIRKYWGALVWLK